MGQREGTYSACVFRPVMVQELNFLARGLYTSKVVKHRDVAILEY